MPSPLNTRATSDRETPILTSQDDDLNSFPAEGSPTGRPADVLSLPEKQVEDGDPLSLFDAEGEPAEILERRPAPAPPLPLRHAPVTPAPSSRPLAIQFTAAAAACVAIAALVTAARLSRPAASLPPVEPRSLQASYDEPASLSSLGTLEPQSADVYPMGPPNLQSEAALDRKTTAAARRPREAAPRTNVPTASRAQTLPTQPRDPMARGTGGSVAPGASDVAASTLTAEVIPPPLIAAAPIPAAAIPFVPTPPTPARTATVRPAPAVLAAPSASVVVNEESAVRTVLDRYRIAYSGLDVEAARAVLPSVDAKALGRAFDRLESQELAFDFCLIAVNGNRATAACGGDTRFVPKVGSRTQRVESRKWTFEMRKTGEQWTISGVDVR